MKVENNYTQGAIDAIKTWGAACGSQTNCAECPIGELRGEEMSCQEFASLRPQKFLSLIRELAEGGISYANEYHLRFPNQDLTAEELVDMGVCRKLIFEGFKECESGDCLACWKELYRGDVTVGFEEEVDPDEESF